MADCLFETINKDEGYEAYLADINYDCKNSEDRGFGLKFSGYSSTLPSFAHTFIQKMK
jgi:secreted Zn-dependent insulinase-like peptidase